MVSEFQQRQSQVRMLSGDHIATAIDAAKRAGIITASEENDESICMTGERFRELAGGVIRSVGPNGEEKLEVQHK